MFFVRQNIFLKLCINHADGTDKSPRAKARRAVEQVRRERGEPYVDWFDFCRKSKPGRAPVEQLYSAAGAADDTKQPCLGRSERHQSAFQTLQSVLQNSATASGNTLSSNSQLSTDLSALGSALSSGDLSTSQSAFATVLGDIKNSASPAQVNEATAASQSLQLVEGLLATLDSNTTSSSTVDNTTSLLQSFYAGQSGLNVLA